MVFNLSQNLIYILFELTIFFILIIQLYLLTSQYGLPFLRKQISTLHKRWKDLQNKLELDIITKKRLETKIKNQEKSFTTLEDKIQQWHTALIEKKESYEKKQIEVANAMFSKKKQQLSSLNFIKAQQSIISQAIATTKQQLQREYAGNTGKLLLTKVLNELGKK